MSEYFLNGTSAQHQASVIQWLECDKNVKVLSTLFSYDKCEVTKRVIVHEQVKTSIFMLAHFVLLTL